MTTPRMGGESVIRVRVAETEPTIAVTGADLVVEGTRAKGPSRWEIECRGGRVFAEGGTGTPMRIEARGSLTVRAPGGFIGFQERSYRDLLRVWSTGLGCEVVNEITLEKYLAGLVNSEFNSKWNEEAIEAQVVAARTYALYQIEQAQQHSGPSTPRYDIDGTVKDQVYDGSLGEDDRASRAVSRTRGMVLTVRGPHGEIRPLKAFYHSTCGGMTELPERVWGKKTAGFTHSVRCGYCATSPRFHWDAELRSQEITDALLKGARAEGRPTGWPTDWAELIRRGTLAAVRPAGLDESGRVNDVVFIWEREWTGPGRWLSSRGGVREIASLRLPATKFRDWIGPTRFRSTAFTVSRRHGLFSTFWHFEGRGNGHGVGMCQWGAKTMGEHGIKMAAILQHYYPDAVLRKLW